MKIYDVDNLRAALLRGRLEIIWRNDSLSRQDTRFSRASENLSKARDSQSLSKSRLSLVSR